MRVIVRAERLILSALSNLTATHSIIQETRSKHLEREKLQAQARAAREAAEASKKQSGSGLATSPRKETQIQRGFEPQPPDTPPKDPARLPPSQPQAQNEIASKPPPPRQQPEVRPPAAQAQGQTAAVPNSPGVAPSHPHVAPKSPAAPAPAGPSPRPAGGAGSGLSPGNGPMPLDMKLPHALQEMMVRFYRFERYSVPLIRSLETRILDIERDSQMAQHGDAMSANSARDREMDKWVGQMTSVMRHEIGQLRAATKEIREGRELIAAIAKQGGPGTRTREPTAADSPSSIRADPGTGTVAGPRGSAAPSPLSQDKGKGRQLDEGSDALSELSASKTRGGPDHAQRKTNISSASFNSAVPRTPKSVHSRTNTLDLPAGAAPALDRDEGKYGRRDVERAPSHGRERSTSPSGRKRYTAALGEAMQDGRISPSARRGEGSVSVSGDESALSTPAPAGERFESPHPPPSPAPSDTHSTTSSIRKRDQSVEDRLRALVGRHASPSQTSMSTSIDEIEELRTDSPEQLRPSTKIGDDYGDTPRGKVAGARANTAPAPAPAPTGHLEAPSPSRTSTLASAHLKAPSATSAISAASGASSATYSPSRNRPGSGWRGTSPGAHSPTPSARSVSPSPSNFVPAATGSSITTHSRASQGLRARAQTYLQNSEKTGGQGATPILAPAPPPRTSTGGGLPARSPSPGAWMSGRAGTSPGAIGSGSSVGPGSWTRRSTSPSPVPSPLPGGPIDGLPSSSRGMDAPTSHLRLSTSPNKMGLRSTSPEPSSSAPIAPLNFERKATAPSSAVAHGPLSPLSPGTPSTPGTPKRTGPASGANLAERIAFFDANK